MRPDAGPDPSCAEELNRLAIKFPHPTATCRSVSTRVLKKLRTHLIKEGKMLSQSQRAAILEMHAKSRAAARSRGC